MSTISPKTKNQKGKYVSSGQKIIIINMFKDITSKTSNVKQKVHAIWLRRELPTIDKILYEVNEDPSFPNFKRTSLYNIIKKLDFVFTERKRCSVLTEHEDLINWRRNYLYDVPKYREKGTIYYLDETWLNGNLTTGPTNPTGKRKRLIILHIGSDKGFLLDGLLCFESKKNSTDYHDEMNGDNFKEWFESFLPRLDPNSIVVMDNAPYHSVQAEKYPSASWKKSEILEWLYSKGVVLDRPMLKAQLVVKVLSPTLLEDIVEDIGANRYSLIVYESTDVSITKYMEYCVRYYSKSLKSITTEFLGLVMIERATAIDLRDGTLEFLKTIKLKPKRIRGLGVDGANNLCGQHNVNIETLEIQWRKLITLMYNDICYPNITIEEKDTSQFWVDVLNITNNYKEQIFHELAIFVLSMLSLPLSNAVVERVFSVMNAVKSKARNRMYMAMLEAIMRIRLYLNVPTGGVHLRRSIGLAGTSTGHLATSIRQIYNQEVVLNPEGAHDYTHLQYRSSLNKMRRRIRPHPSSRFFQHNFPLMVDGERLGVIFANTDAIEKYRGELQSIIVAGVDGTFKTVPKNPTDLKKGCLLTFHIVFRNMSFQMVYALTTRMTQSTYESFLRISEQILPLNYDRLTIITDYERGLMNAVRIIFPHTKLQGCWFHFCQSVIRYCKRSMHSLYDLFQTTVEAATVLRMVLALPHLPAEAQINCNFTMFDGFQKINFWLTEIGAVNISVFGSDIRTNNYVESFHATLLTQIGKHITII
ncbi:unnamed protein product [Macrosiphum euphorbiae]|uniref:Transposase n=1 Tax=Macrosiphum euphorbiae TaxID=13131 RepID=A0AAV0WUI1_9HEMI|nr:unnamed protein product [Macrosiphum euphorbiae]